jgi:hypothetical protein
MYEHENGNRTRRAPAERAFGAPADEGDARAQARRALQDAYDWRDDEPGTSAGASAAGTADAAKTGDSVRSAAARAEARRSRREVVRSISRTVGV